MSHASDLQFSVEGNPRPQGSKTAVRSGNKARVIEAGNNTSRAQHRAWRDAVTVMARKTTCVCNTAPRSRRLPMP